MEACASHACARFQLPENEKDWGGGGGGSYSPLGPFRKTSSHGSSIQWPCGRATQTAVVFFVSFPPLTVFTLPSGLDASRICNHKGLLPFFSCLMK